LCYIFHNTHGTHTNTIRPFNVFGPGMQETDYRVLPNFASRIKGGLPLHVYGTGNQTRTFCYITDAIVGFLSVVTKGIAGEAYNIGGENDATGIDVAHAILSRLGKPESLIEFVKDRAGHDQRYALDSSKVRALGWNPEFDFAAAMNQTIDWYVANEPWWRQIKASEEYRQYYERQYKNR